MENYRLKQLAINFTGYAALIISFFTDSTAILPALAIEQAQLSQEALDQVTSELTKGSISQRSYERLLTILEKEPNNCRAHLLMGNCCDLFGLPDQALVQYKLALKYGHQVPEAYIELIRSLVQAGQISNATFIISEAKSHFPDNKKLLVSIGNIFLQKQYLKESEAVYLDALGHRQFDTAHGEREPSSARLSNSQIGLLSNADLASNSSDRYSMIGLASGLAMIKLTQGRYQLALRLARQDLTIAPDLMVANEAAGVALCRLGLYDQALPYLDKAFSELTAANSQNLCAAKVARFSGDYAQALYWSGYYDKALLPCVLALCQQSYIYMGTLIGPSSSLANGRGMAGISAEHLTKSVLAKVNQSSVSALSLKIRDNASLNNNANLHLSLANLFNDRGFYQPAIFEYEAALKLDQGNADIWYRLAQVLELHTNDCKTALDCYRKAGSLRPGDDLIAKHLGRLEDRLANQKSDWAWQWKTYLGFLI